MPGSRPSRATIPSSAKAGARALRGITFDLRPRLKAGVSGRALLHQIALDGLIPRLLERHLLPLPGLERLLDAKLLRGRGKLHGRLGRGIPVSPPDLAEPSQLPHRAIGVAFLDGQEPVASARDRRADVLQRVR